MKHAEHTQPFAAMLGRMRQAQMTTLPGDDRCAVQGCSRGRVGKGEGRSAKYCGMHYKRWCRTGSVKDPEWQVRTRIMVNAYRSGVSLEAIAKDMNFSTIYVVAQRLFELGERPTRSIRGA